MQGAVLVTKLELFGISCNILTGIAVFVFHENAGHPTKVPAERRVLFFQNRRVSPHRQAAGHCGRLQQKPKQNGVLDQHESRRTGPEPYMYEYLSFVYCILIFGKAN